MDDRALLFYIVFQNRKKDGVGNAIKNEEACVNNRKLLRINGEKHDEMLLPLTPLSVLMCAYATYSGRSKTKIVTYKRISNLGIEKIRAADQGLPPER
jgi:hypothetical protein